jgi:hypothetical protein
LVGESIRFYVLFHQRTQPLQTALGNEWIRMTHAKE